MNTSRFTDLPRERRMVSGTRWRRIKRQTEGEDLNKGTARHGVEHISQDYANSMFTRSQLTIFGLALERLYRLRARHRGSNHPETPGTVSNPIPLVPPLVARRRRTIRLSPPHGWPTIDLRELWAYRGLFFFLVWRDIKVRYAQSVLGVGWAIVQPVTTMIVFTAIFGTFARIPSDGVPYPVFSLAALVPWSYFSQAFSSVSGSLTSSSNLLTKVYFPRLIIPFSTVISGLTTFAIAFLILLVMQLAYGIRPSLSAFVVLPLLVAVMMMTAAGIGCWLAALQVQYRDIRPITGFAVQVWMYLSPVVYPLSIVPDRYQQLYMLNPLAAVIEGFRSVLLGTQAVNWSSIAVALAMSGALFVSGVLFFRKLESRFADVV